MKLLTQNPIRRGLLTLLALVASIPQLPAQSRGPARLPLSRPQERFRPAFDDDDERLDDADDGALFRRPGTTLPLDFSDDDRRGLSGRPAFDSRPTPGERWNGGRGGRRDDFDFNFDRDDGRGFEFGDESNRDFVPARRTVRPADRWPGRLDDVSIPSPVRRTDPVQTAPRGRTRETLPPRGATETEIQNRITRRYQAAGMAPLLRLSPQQALQLYQEVLEQIAARHLQPAAVDAMARRGLSNLVQAVRNPAFMQVHGQSAPAPWQAQFAANLQEQAQAVQTTTVRGAVQLAANVAGTARQFGLSPTPVVIEFIYGAAESLDKYSTFVLPERTAGSSLQLNSHVVGIGVQIEAAEAGVQVQRVFAGGPAAEAGLLAEDLILAVDGRPLAGVDLEAAAGLITGPAGSQVQLDVGRGTQGRFRVAVTRRPVAVTSVNEVKLLGGQARVGYFQLDKFSESSPQEVDQALWTLHRQGMQSLVIDLRGNPGGLLSAAVEIADKFLTDGIIVSTRGRTAADNLEERAHPQQTWKVPLVVLIDENSASASEILAAAIQENGRGVIVGRTSYGKGTVQTQFPLQTGGASLRLTTARFFSPDGRPMADAGVAPDVEVPAGTRGTAGAAEIDAAVRVAAQAALRR